MINVDIPGANCTLGKKQPEYTPLIARVEDTESVRADNGETYTARSITVGFKPTPEEMVALLNGGTLYVRQLGGWSPTAMWVE